MIDRDIHAPKVATVHIVAIRIEQDRFLVWSKRPLLYFAISRSKKLWRASGGGQSIQMLPAVLFGSDDKLIAGSPIDDAAAGVFRHVGIRSLRRRAAAVPNLFGRSRGGIGDPDGPRMRFVRSNEEALRCVSRLGGSSNKSDALSVERPQGITCGIDRWRHELHGLRGEIIHSNIIGFRYGGGQGPGALIRYTIG